MLLVFQIIFSAPIISWIESIRGGRGVGSGEPKVGQNNHLDSKSSALPSVFDIN